MKKSRDENHTFCATRPNSSRPFYATRPSSSRLFFCIINFLKILLLILRYSFENLCDDINKSIRFVTNSQFKSVDELHSRADEISIEIGF